MAGEDIKDQKLQLATSELVSLDTNPYFQHISSLLICNLSGMFTKQRVLEPVPRRPIQITLDVDITERFAAVAYLLAECAEAETVTLRLVPTTIDAFLARRKFYVMQMVEI